MKAVFLSQRVTGLRVCVCVLVHFSGTQKCNQEEERYAFGGYVVKQQPNQTKKKGKPQKTSDDKTAIKKERELAAPSVKGDDSPNP